MNLKTDGAYYIGDYGDCSLPEQIFFDFIECAEYDAYKFIGVYNSKGKAMGVLELVNGDYE